MTRAAIARRSALVIALAAGLGVAWLVGAAIARSFTLEVARHATVTNQAHLTRHESLVVTAGGAAVYALTGDSRRHPKCTKANGCFGFWPPLTVSSSKKLSKAPGISGRLGVWRRDGILQVTLAGHPLYRFAGDSRPRHATGEGIHGFGGTWHAVRPNGSTAGGGSGTMTPGPTTSPTTTTTPTTTIPTPCLYPPYC
jgi:predicted lipoprotein with Yx(FWY)xxD motif